MLITIDYLPGFYVSHELLEGCETQAKPRNERRKQDDGYRLFGIKP
jgi:hypothetical protein